MNPHVGGTTRRLVGDAPADIVHAADILRAGGLVAFPTETVYGLGADAANDAAVARIFAAKGRPADHPLIVHIAAASEMLRWAQDIPGVAWQLAAQFWPGPLTLILKRAPGMAVTASGGLDTIGLRVPGQPVALALLNAFGGGIAAPSANRFGRISPTCAEHVMAELDGRIDVLIDGGVCEVGLESTILDLTSARPQVLRPGAVTAAQLADIVGELENAAAGKTPKPSTTAPGTLEAHYAPATPLRLIEPARLQAEAIQCGQAGGVAVLARSAVVAGFAGGSADLWIAMPHTAAAYGHALYARLREADAAGCATILIEQPPAGVEWTAVNDRLGRAAFGSGRQTQDSFK